MSLGTTIQPCACSKDRTQEVALEPSGGWWATAGTSAAGRNLHFLSTWPIVGPPYFFCELMILKRKRAQGSLSLEGRDFGNAEDGRASVDQ